MLRSRCGGNHGSKLADLAFLIFTMSVWLSVCMGGLVMRGRGVGRQDTDCTHQLSAVCRERRMWREIQRVR